MISIQGYIIGCIGVWLVSDGLYSWSLYHNASTYGSSVKQTFWRDHYIRLIRILMGIALIILGVTV